jgi:hypothetical protein
MGESPSEFHAHLQLDKRGAVEGWGICQKTSLNSLRSER